MDNGKAGDDEAPQPSPVMSQFEDLEAITEPTPEPSTSALRHDNPNRELSPEPDQDLNTSRGTHQVWLVKVPKFLIDGWSRIQQDDLRLGTVRVYEYVHQILTDSPDESGQQKMELLLPEAPLPAIPVEDLSARAEFANIPRHYDMRLTSTTQETYEKNLYAFQEEVLDDDDVASELGVDEDIVMNDLSDSKRPRSSGPARLSTKRKRLTYLTGTVTNETALQPQRTTTQTTADSKNLAKGGVSRSLLTPEYREILRQRRMDASKPKRTVIMMDDMDAGSNNMLAAGVGKGHIKNRAANIVMAASQARSKEAPEKFARMPRNELLDLLFSLFDRYKHWSLKRLREETQQPYVYLREVLASIADQHHNGPYAGSWSLKREYSEGQRTSTSTTATGGTSSINKDAPKEDFDDVV